eukprot:UN08663
MFLALFRKYIEIYNAPLEINISHAVNLSLKKCYDGLLHAQQMGGNSNVTTDVEFIDIWNNLVIAAREITSILKGSAQRCRYKVVDMKFM